VKKIGETAMSYQIQTARLTLTACPAQVARAASGGKRQLESLMGARLDDEWLDEDGRGLLSFYDYQLRGDPEMLGWGLWLIKHNADQIVFGSIGFKGKPNHQGTVEIGYGIAPTFRRQGYTFEAAVGLVEWGWQDPRVQRITAECLPDNLGSKRILEKLGMTCTGKQGGYLKWYVDR
jgi:ribosomal-protein-alanine N-acetyltransferase